MKYIVSGTNRPRSRTLTVAKTIQKIYKSLGEETEIIDLREIPLHEMDGKEYATNAGLQIRKLCGKIEKSDGLIIVCPEYNGSLPGILKYFIDHWSYPQSFSFRPVSLVGLGGRFGGFRPIEHLQQIFAYRDAYIFPLKVYFPNVWEMIKEDGELEDKTLLDLLRQQAQGFRDFVQALEKAGLDANSILKRQNET